MNGYFGRFLRVDLGSGKIEEMPVSDEDLRDFIGGATLGARLVYDHVDKGLDPLAPGNPLVFATGPFTATAVPMASRWAVCGVSPLTGYWGEATSGGVFPFRLKGAGVDGLFITGRAQGPVYLHVKNGSAEIRDAAHIWGSDTYETQRVIKEELGESGLSVACIGEAGERRLRYACIINDNGRAAGRCGLGAVMGSKNLKAVAASGEMRPEVADEAALRELAREAAASIRGSLLSVAFREYGTLMYMDMGMILGDVPAKYYRKSVFPAEKVTGQALRQSYTVENYACLGCPIGCGRLIRNFTPELEQVDGPEYETTAVFGPLCMNFDLESIIRANHFCNAHGLDTISAGVSIAYAMYLAEQGVLDEKKVGFEIRWGDGDAVLRLLEMILKEQGIGLLLSEGTLRMALELGRDPEEASQVKGMEVPMHDGRAFHGLAVSYATGPRGACHLKGDYYNVELGGGVAEYNILPGDRLASAGKGQLAAKYQSWKDIFDALTLCKFAPLSPTLVSRLLSAITGLSYTPEDLLRAGDRSINIKRAISLKLGLTRQEDRLPRICSEALSEGSTAGVVPDMELMLKDYYNYRGWDWESGKPKKDKLMELGLERVAEDLYS
jgi:aldehyde:ferredoxin oxidoreductase